MPDKQREPHYNGCECNECYNKQLIAESAAPAQPVPPSKCPDCGAKFVANRACLDCGRIRCNMGVVVGLTTCGQSRMCENPWHGPAAPSPVLTPSAELMGSWPKDCIQRVFVDGAAWWEFKSTGATLWQSDRDLVEAEAINRYGNPMDELNTQIDVLAARASSPAVAPTAGIIKNKTTPENRAFWNHVEKTAKEVDSWAPAVAGRTQGNEDTDLQKKLERAESARRHTQDWYALHYGKLHDWARKILPEEYVNQFFSCIANGTWGTDDVGEPYMSVGAGMITPSGYIKFDSAQEQILHDQTMRAEEAELELAALRESASEAPSEYEIAKASEEIMDLFGLEMQCAPFDGRDKAISPDELENLHKILRTLRREASPEAPAAPSCPDCNEAAKHAYSDATTPGFFSPKCAKHREAL